MLEIGQKKIILLPPQLCTFESMPELMSKNKTLVNKYRKNPTEKLAAVKEVVADIAKKTELDEWGISLSPKPFSFSARILEKPLLVVGDSKKPTRAITDSNSFQNQIL